MVSLLPPTVVLTAADAASRLTADQLDAFGLVMPVLSREWSTEAPSGLDDDHLTLQLSGSLKAPFHGVGRYLPSGGEWRDVTGQPVTGPVLALSMHPEAARRLLSLVSTRLGPAGAVRPVATTLLVHGLSWMPPAGAAPNAKPVVQSVRAGDVYAPLGPAALTVSFHDEAGLPVDPLATACLYADLLAWLPGLGVGSITAAGGLSAAVGLDVPAQPFRYHLVSPHGVLSTPSAGLGLTVPGGASVSSSTGTVPLAVGQSLALPSGSPPASTVYWGFAPGGFLDQVPLAPPALPAGVTLARQFFRVMVADLSWHLLGNRAKPPILGVPGDPAGAAPPAWTLPLVRPRVPGFAYLADGMSVLGSMGQLAAAFPPSGADSLPLLCSPSIDATLALPPAPGATGQWPAFPPTAAPVMALPAGADLGRLASAAWRSPDDGPGANRDVVVTFAAGAALPAGAHVRVFPRAFVTIGAIGEQPSFVRGDGGSAVVAANTPTKLLLVNPFNLAAAEALPGGPITVDIVATARDGSRRLASQRELPLTGAPESWSGSTAAFGGLVFLSNPLVTVWTNVLGVTAVAPVNVFGIPAPPAPPGPAPTSIVDAVRKLANETTAPRVGPHLPSQARFDTVLALGSAASGGGPRYVWQAVLTGGRWSWETRSAHPELGDPGNPAGPDVHASGVRVGGQLGYDLALHALKRAQPVLPVAAGALGWLVVTDGNNWGLPATDTTGTVAGVMLETIAPFVDSPELGLLPVPTPTDTVQNAVNGIASKLGISPAPQVQVANEAQLRQELQREIQTAKAGQHDALLSLTRALLQAEDYVYLEGPAFSATSFGGDGGIDLVALLAARLQAVPRLKLMICVPRLPDFALGKANWVRAGLAQRAAAITTLTTAAPGRVAAFSPVGFPGRASAIRSTVVLVDDVYASVGTSHLRRRGMTFDGGVDIASIDRQLDGWGVSASIAAFRQQLVAAKLGVASPVTAAATSALWTRLARPASTFSALSELLAEGGQGRCSPVWGGPTDTSVIPQSDAVSDPNGLDATETTLLQLYGTLVLEA